LSLTSIFSTNTAISETNPVSEKKPDVAMYATSRNNSNYNSKHMSYALAFDNKAY